jgi:HAD superfamily hydrolase (TIGR01484 family)
MGKFDGVLLASDFDNTLIYTSGALHSGQPIPPLGDENRRALEYFMSNGGRFCVATGRALAAFAPLAPLAPMNAPCILCNGAAIYDFFSEKYLEFATLDEVARTRVQQVLDVVPEAAAEAYNLGNTIYAVHPNRYTRDHERITKVTCTEAVSMEDVPLPLGKVLFEGANETLKQVRQTFVERGWAQDYELIFSNTTLLEMTRQGATKGGMLLRLAEMLHISPEHIYAAGDEANDVSMLITAAEGFAPANCSDAVRGCGATIVSDAREHAMADIIAILDSRY